jgi:hypothetical protein
MGLGRYLRQRIAVPIVERLTAHGQLLAETHLRELLSKAPYTDPGRLEPYGYRSFSQNDEDGIIEEIFRRIGIEHRTFVEFGVQDGMENNSRLLLYQGWRGLWIEADSKACAAIRRNFSTELGEGRLQLLNEWVTPANIGELIRSAGFENLDLLSIDVDGPDYWIWESIEIRPRVVVIEYNAKFRPPTRWVMAQNTQRRWNFTDYHGASLQSLADLGAAKGYRLVGSCLAGVNAFFVRDDLVQDRFAKGDAAAFFNPPRY